MSPSYCWPFEVFDPGTPSQAAEISLRHRSTLSKSPVPRTLSCPLVLWDLSLWQVTRCDGHTLVQTCQRGPNKGACLWLSFSFQNSFSIFFLLKLHELTTVLPVFEFLFDLEIFDSIVLLLKICMKILKQGFYTISEPVTMIHLAICTFFWKCSGMMGNTSCKIWVWFII